ncbi:hypothetical protein [Sulfitobacter guttiformis]|uniref:Uncharacterized protein n=1 Tax=Sulfitobacter guttiformis TaxID=74349 RepID=A0A420DU07_9RHOB|nr:hypothetical protein [Sulfitobacter guttiformis]KIN71152.1 hypothetical protein Z949_309 [Sulfitobacter guttiformis KCTC 32187]RKE97629.1 hypothetical protein C8N30_2245 [Sulfitobacter guttiformis]
MAKLNKTDVFTTAEPRSETKLEKTIRASKEITETETERREEKTTRLREARRKIEADANIKSES